MSAAKSKVYLAGIIFLTIFIEGCKQKNVTVTKDFVINPYWDKSDNSFSVTKMMYRDGQYKTDLENVSASELLAKLIDDSSFSFVTNVKYNGEDYSKRRVYFNRYNGFSWSKVNERHSNYEQDTIGELQPNAWYLLQGIGEEKTLYYLFLDSLGNFRTVKVPASAWTNF